MNYQQTLDYLYHKLPMFSKMGSAALKKDLTNTIKICEALGNPHHQFKSIHIAGTNGKGSVSHMLAATLQTVGYKTALYTSPHLYDFRERIRVNGDMVNEDFVVSFVNKVKPLIEEIEPSFFEITVAMAFEYFAQQKADVAVIETGLGGRLDSTNVITPVLSIITNIGYDHMNILGSSLSQIAAEKAGIIKEHVPVVIGEKNKETKQVFEETAIRRKAPLFFAEDHFEVLSFTLRTTHIDIVVKEEQERTKKYQLDLPGIYQTKNLVTLLASLKVLHQQGWNINDDAIAAALMQTKKLTGLHGRWEVVREKPAVVLEVAHNEAGIRQMLEHLKNISYHHLHLVIGMVKDKDTQTLLSLLPPTATYYFTQAHIPRALDKVQLQQHAQTISLDGAVYENVNEAVAAAMQSANEDDIIVVCGSIFLVAEVDRVLLAACKQSATP